MQSRLGLEQPKSSAHLNFKSRKKETSNLSREIQKVCLVGIFIPLLSNAFLVALLGVAAIEILNINTFVLRYLSVSWT